MAGLQAGMATATGLLNAFKNSVGNLAFGMQNMGTAGTIGMDAIKQGVVGLGGVFLALGAIVAVAAAAVAIGLGVQAVRAAGDFQQSVTKLFTTAGELHSNLQMVGDGMLTMAGQVGTGAQQLSNAMYYVESGGYHGAAGLEVLRVAAMGAKAENADLNGVAKVLTFTMNAYAAQHLSASTAMNILIASTARGTMTLGELSGAVSNVLPAASRFGISMIDVGAALATMTSQGDKADSAATHLRQVILALEAPSKIGAAALKSVGLTTQQVADEMKVSLPGALQMITDAVGKKFPVGSAAYNAAIRDIAGGSRQMMGFLELTGVHLKTFQDNVSGVTDAVHKGGTSIMGWADVQANFNFKMDAAKASMGALFIVVGQQLLPVITQLMGQVAPLVTSFTQWLITSGALKNAVNLLSGGISAIVTVVTSVVGFFQRWEIAADLLKAVLIVLAVIIGATMVAALYSYAAAAYVAAAANIAAFWPIYLIVLAVVVVIALVILAVQHWGEIAHWIQGVWGAVANWFQSVWGALGAWFQNLFQTIGTSLSNAWNTAVNDVKNVVNGAVKWLQDTWNTCVQAVVNAFMWLYNHNYYFRDLVNTIRNVISAVVKWLQDTWNTIVNVIVGLWNGLVKRAEFTWHYVYYTIQYYINLVQHYIQVVWNTIIGWLAGVWKTISKDVSTMWSTISGVFGNAWNTYIAGPLATLWTNISGWFNNLKTTAFTWGKNLIQGFIDGINNMIGAVGNAAQGIMKTVSNFLGFHSPAKEGPGRYLMDWGPALAGGFAEGIVQGIPQVQAAVNMMVSPIPQAIGSVSTSPSGPAPRSTGGGNREIVDALGRIERQLAGGRRVTSDEIIDALGNGLTRRILTTTGGIG